MGFTVRVIGAGLAGSEAALQLARRGIRVELVEMRPGQGTDVHKTGDCAELVCSNSLKSTKADSAAGMLKAELRALGSPVFAAALRHAVPAGGALAVNRGDFSREVTELVEREPLVTLVRREATDVEAESSDVDALVLASGPLTSDGLADSLARITGREHLAFYDAAAPIVMAESLDRDRLFRQSRYEEGAGDYINAPFTMEEYDAFIDALLGADRVIARDFETRDLFQACQPIEELARKGRNTPRFGPLKPVGLTDPATGRRPWAALQLRAEDAYGQCYNLVGFQTNLTFPEQRRVFRLIPGLENAEFARYGVMHRNTFIDAPRLLDAQLRLSCAGTAADRPIYVAGQLAGTEGYVEAIRAGAHVALSVAALAEGVEAPALPPETAFGALLAYATDEATKDYQPSHVNFGLVPPLERPIKQKAQRHRAFAERGSQAFGRYADALRAAGLMPASGSSAAGEAAELDACGKAVDAEDADD